MALRNLVALTQKTLVEARRAVWDMRSPSLAGGDLTTDLRATAEKGLRGTGLDLEFGAEGESRSVDPDFRTYGGDWGLLGMRERASQIGARLSARSMPGQGTEIALLTAYAMPGATRTNR